MKAALFSSLAWISLPPDRGNSNMRTILHSFFVRHTSRIQHCLMQDQSCSVKIWDTHTHLCTGEVMTICEVWGVLIKPETTIFGWFFWKMRKVEKSRLLGLIPFSQVRRVHGVISTLISPRKEIVSKKRLIQVDQAKRILWIESWRPDRQETGR